MLNEQLSSSNEDNTTVEVNLYSTDKLKHLKIIKHDTIESVYAEYCGVSIEELQFLKTDSYETSDGVLKISFSQLKEMIENNGYWGFALTEEVEIHYWVKNNVAKKDLIFFFAHELGHIIGKADKDDLQEELRADSYAKVALKAYELALNF